MYEILMTMEWENAPLVGCFDELFVRKDVLLTHSRRLWLIRNRDTAVIIRLNNSLSPGLSKNVPKVPSSFFYFPPSVSSSPIYFSYHRWKTNCRPMFRENSEKLLFISLKASGYEKESKPTESIQLRETKVARHAAVTERPSSRHYFLRI